MNRTIVIGLDGATFSVLDPLMKDGVMPFLARLVERGVRADLMSTPNPLTPPAWTSLATGRTPGNHGLFDFIRPEETTSGVFIKLMSGRDVRCETIWSLVGRRGGRAAVLNYPMTYPIKGIVGYLVPGFVPLRHLKRAIHPPEFYDTLVSIPGFDRRELAMDLDREKEGIQGLPPEKYAEWIRVHTRRERQWYEIFRHIIEHDPCELMAVLFDGADKLQHLVWRFVDGSSFPKQPTAWEQEIRDLCLAYFRDVDGYLEGIVTAAGPEARVFIASDHGFGPTLDIVYLNVWLQQHGYLHWGTEAPLDEGGNVLAQRMKHQYSLLDWSRTTAYALSPSSNGIYIRVARTPGQPGISPERYESFRQELIDGLLDFRDPESGERIIARVMTREDAFPGTYMHLAPDLTLVLRDHGFISILNADAPLKRRQEVKGMHRPEGIFLAAGPGLKRGVSLPALSIVDVASAVLHSLGLELPDDLEGRFPAEVFEESFLAAHPPVGGGAIATGTPAGAAPDTAGLDADEEEAVLSRLQALGYIE